MTALIKSISVSAVIACGTAAYGSWAQLAPIPDNLGVAAPFAGVSGQVLLVAGGANFPDKAPWDGGKKVWHDTVYSLASETGDWSTAGKLPRAIGYGVSVSFRNRMVCVGGSDADRCYPDAYWLDLDHSRIRATTIPPLPIPISNACGVCVGNILYIAGGQTANDATEAARSVFAIDLTDTAASWKSIEPIPGAGRILATAAAFDDSLYIFGGAALSADANHSPRRQYLSDAYRYNVSSGWKRLKDLPSPIVGAPSPSPTDQSGIFIIGGDDGSHVGFKPANLHPGFSKVMLHFNPRSGNWTTIGEMPAGRVTVPCVSWNDKWVITSGEMRPGVRSPQVWMFNPKQAR